MKYTLHMPTNFPALKIRITRVGAKKFVVSFSIFLIVALFAPVRKISIDMEARISDPMYNGVVVHPNQVWIQYRIADKNTVYQQKINEKNIPKNLPERVSVNGNIFGSVLWFFF